VVSTTTKERRKVVVRRVAVGEVEYWQGWGKEE
jgi:hypothetical protein